MSKIVTEVSLRTKGILPVQKLKLLVEAGVISGAANYPIEENQFQPNSVDLRLGETAYGFEVVFCLKMKPFSRKWTSFANTHSP